MNNIETTSEIVTNRGRDMAETDKQEKTKRIFEQFDEILKMDKDEYEVLFKLLKERFPDKQMQIIDMLHKLRGD